jgi:hypothetical protein
MCRGLYHGEASITTYALPSLCDASDNNSLFFFTLCSQCLRRRHFRSLFLVSEGMELHVGVIARLRLELPHLALWAWAAEKPLANHFQTLAHLLQFALTSHLGTGGGVPQFAGVLGFRLFETTFAGPQDGRLQFESEDLGNFPHLVHLLGCTFAAVPFNNK